MADKKLNAVSTASDGAYIYAEDASGNQIKISKADLASVVAGLLGIDGTITCSRSRLLAQTTWNTSFGTNLANGTKVIGFRFIIASDGTVESQVPYNATVANGLLNVSLGQGIETGKYVTIIYTAIG